MKVVIGICVVVVNEEVSVIIDVTVPIIVDILTVMVDSVAVDPSVVYINIVLITLIKR